MYNKLNLMGQRFGKLVVIEEAKKSRRGLIHWLCQCDCGNTHVVSTDHLTRKSHPVRSCGCMRKYSGNKHKDWKGCGEISGAWWSTHVTREKNQYMRTKVPMTITIEYAWELFLSQDRKCNLSGLPLRFSNLGLMNTASLDRIDNSKGYEEGNVQWVHKHVNFMKGTLGNEYFKRLCRLITEKEDETQNQTIGGSKTPNLRTRDRRMF